MPKFQKKPVQIEAIQLGRGNINEVSEWIRTKADESRITSAVVNWHSERGASVEIETLEGTMTASLGDWIICGVQGELYPCKPDIFEETYLPVDDAEVRDPDGEAFLTAIASHVDAAAWSARGRYGHDDNGLDDPVNVWGTPIDEAEDGNLNEGFHPSVPDAVEKIADLLDERVGEIAPRHLRALALAAVDEVGMPCDAEDLAEGMDLDGLVNEALVALVGDL